MFRPKTGDRSIPLLKSLTTFWGPTRLVMVAAKSHDPKFPTPGATSATSKSIWSITYPMTKETEEFLREFFGDIWLVASTNLSEKYKRQNWVHLPQNSSGFFNVILLMVQKSRELTSWGNGSSSHFLQGFLHPTWCRISEPSTVWWHKKTLHNSKTSMIFMSMKKLVGSSW